MSKKKDFKGMASKIVSSPVTSLDDFLDADDQEPAPKRTARAPKQKTKETISPKIAPPAQKEPSDQEKTRVSLYLAIRTSFELDDLKTSIRRAAPRNELKKISKSSIVEAAVDIVKADFEKNGMNSEIVQRILN